MGKGTAVAAREGKGEYGLVDIMKVVCCVIVVAKHCYLSDYDVFNWLVKATDAAVQMFFIYSGFFLAKEGTLGDADKMRHYVKRLLILFFVWLVPCFFVNMRNTSDVPIIYILNTSEFFNMLSSGHLWYVQHLLVVALLLFALQKRRFRLWQLTIIMMLSSLFYGNLTCALTSVAAGIYIANPGFGERRGIRFWIEPVCCIAALVIWMIYWKPIHTDTSIYCLIFIITFLIGMLTLNVKLCVKWKGFRAMRKFSTICYFAHPAMIPFLMRHVTEDKLRRMNLNLPCDIGLAWSLILTAATLTCCVILSVLVISLARVRGLRWLKYIY